MQVSRPSPDAGRAPGNRTPHQRMVSAMEQLGHAAARAACRLKYVCSWSRQLGRVAARARRRSNRPPPYSRHSTPSPPQSPQSTRPPPLLGNYSVDLRVGEKGRKVEQDSWRGSGWRMGIFSWRRTRAKRLGEEREGPCPTIVLFRTGTHNTNI
jgi:hypothetical protein